MIAALLSISVLLVWLAYRPRSDMPPATSRALRRAYRRGRADLRGARIHSRIVVAPTRSR